VRLDLTRPVTRPLWVAVVATCLVAVACNQAPPTAPTASGSLTPTAVASGLRSNDSVASPVASGVAPSSSTSPGAELATSSPAVAGSPGDAGPAGLHIVESGFTAFSADGNDFASFAAILDNPNDRWAVLRMHIAVEFFDADDTFLAGQELFIQILPGQRTAIAGEVFGAGRASRMAVNVPDDTTAFEASQASAELFRISGIETSRRDGLNVTDGRLTSRASAAESLVQLVAVYRDGRGAIIGGAVGGVDSIGSGATLTFEIIDSAPYPGISGTEVYWQVSGVRR
jgi:hypothetical protein